MKEMNGNHQLRSLSISASRDWLDKLSFLPIIVAYIFLEIVGTKANWGALETLRHYRLVQDTLQSIPTLVFYETGARETFFDVSDIKEPRSIIDMWLGNRDEHHPSFKEQGILTHPITMDGQDGQDVCEPAAEWQSWVFPTCNKLHELEFQLIDEDSAVLENEEEFGRKEEEPDEEEEIASLDDQSSPEISQDDQSSQELEREELQVQRQRRTLDRHDNKQDEELESDLSNNSLFDLIDNFAPIMTLLGTGTSRDAWKVEIGLPNREQDSVVLKTFHYDRPFSPKSFHHQRLDAIVSERLTFSPHVADIYGYCGLSVLNELGQHVDMQPIYTAMDRLRFSRDLAAGLRDAHHGLANGRSEKENVYDAPRHDDIEFVQRNAAMVVHADIRQNNAFLSLETGKMKLSDFNQGIFLGRNKLNDEPCGYLPEFSYWHDRLAAPEECMGTVQNEKTDVYHLGGMIFYFLTGFKPYHENKHALEDRIKKKNAASINATTWILPQLPPRFAQSRIPSVVAMRNAVTACFRFDPKERASATEIFFMLDNSLSMLEKRVKRVN